MDLACLESAERIRQQNNPPHLSFSEIISALPLQSNKWAKTLQTLQIFFWQGQSSMTSDNWIKLVEFRALCFQPYANANQTSFYARGIHCLGFVYHLPNAQSGVGVGAC